MATIPTFVAPARSITAPVERSPSRGGVALCALLTPFALLVHGYHPYAEDGGIYVAGIKYLLHRQLYPSSRAFVTSHLRLSIFAPVVAFLTKTSGIDVMAVLFALYAASIFLTLFAAWQVASRLFPAPEARRWAVTLFAAALTVPVAGTSLMLMDPYVTARNLAAPCVLFAIAAALDLFRASQAGAPMPARSMLLLGTAGCCALLFHPLMGGYGLAIVVLLAAFALPGRMQRLACLAALAMLLAAGVSHFGPVEPAGYAAVAQTRTYWFLPQWAWYEWLGLVCPLAILLWFSARRGNRAAVLLARSAAYAGLIGALIALLFARHHAASFAVARLQPLRILQIIYVLMLLYLGAFLGSLRVKGRVIVAGIICCGAALALYLTQRSIYAESNHLETPWTTPANQWEQGFLWIRLHTPTDATVALDADYISIAGEDAQGFRAIAERSMPADLSKDGGIAAIRPELTGEWLQGVALQQGLNRLNDAGRLQRLGAAHIHWLVLASDAVTAFRCPYRNSRMQVCELPAEALAK